MHQSGSIWPTLLLAALTCSAWGQDVLQVINPADMPAEGVAMRVGAYVGNDMVPVKQFDAKVWPNYQTRSGADLALADLRLDFGASKRGWNVGYFYREDWRLASNRDTVDAYALSQRRQYIGQNRSYELNYRLDGFSADGLRMGHTGLLPMADDARLLWGWSAALLRGQGVKQETVQGVVISGASSGSLHGNREMFNTNLNPAAVRNGLNDFVPGQSMGVSTGLGYGLDLGATWLGKNGERASLAVNDLAASIHWDRLPYLSETINNLSVPAATPGPGPSFQGVSAYRPLTLRLKPKYLLEGEYPYGHVTAMARLEGADGDWFPQFGLHYALSQSWRLGMDYETRFGAYGLNLRYRAFYAGISTQNPDLARSRAISASAGTVLSF